jgi:ammonia channel protein AmtB
VGLEGLFLVVAIEVCAWVLNWYVVVGALDMVDPGGGVHIHMFGGLFGVAASLGLASAFPKKERYAELKTSTDSEIFSVMGALIIFIMLPGFNAALAPADTQGRAILNTVFGLLCSGILTFAISHWRNWRKGYRLSMIDMSNGMIMGGIAVASAHNLIGGAFMGTLDAFVVVPLCFFFIYFLKPVFSRSSFFNDVRDVMWRHAVPGIFAGIAATVALNVYVGQRRGGVNYVDLFRNGNGQASRNIFGVCVTLGISVAAGLIAGGIVGGMRSSGRIKKPVRPFTEESSLDFAFDYIR